MRRYRAPRFLAPSGRPAMICPLSSASGYPQVSIFDYFLQCCSKMDTQTVNPSFLQHFDLVAKPFQPISQQVSWFWSSSLRKPFLKEYLRFHCRWTVEHSPSLHLQGLAGLPRLQLRLEIGTLEKTTRVEINRRKSAFFSKFLHSFKNWLHGSESLAVHFPGVPF